MLRGLLCFSENGIYYLMWSEGGGGWTNESYKVAYAMADQTNRPLRAYRYCFGKKIVLQQAQGIIRR